MEVSQLLSCFFYLRPLQGNVFRIEEFHKEIEMLNRQEKGRIREEIFRHLDGIVTAPTAYALYEKGVLSYLLEKQRVSLSQITDAFKANEGYLNVALRILCSQGWLIQHLDNQADQIEYEINDQSAFAFQAAGIYKDVVELLEYTGHFHPRKFEKEPFTMLNSICTRHINKHGWKMSEDEQELKIQEQMLKHIEGILVGPTTVHLGMSGMFHKYFMEASFRPDEFHTDPESFGDLLDFLSHLNWFKKGNNNTYKFTEKGLFFARRASAYGVTVSYIPTFRYLHELIFGDPDILRNNDPMQPERHVDREMNVWGSGGAHTTYFKKVDEVIIDLFNKPIHEQPKGILDMGCGNGAFLKHIYEVIEQRTLRGEMLDDHPLFFGGS